ncbi:MAG: hypothetical protein J7M25_09900 [Deltaproteobacteria bacterium]|nr:hypothetical protein [Deltaproteobacteria bacterium]
MKFLQADQGCASGDCEALDREHAEAGNVRSLIDVLVPDSAARVQAPLHLGHLATGQTWLRCGLLIHQDYVMRFIRQFVEAVARMLKLRDNGNLDAALRECDSTYDLFGVPREICDVVYSEILVGLFHYQEMMRAAAKLFRKEAVIYERKRDPVTAFAKVAARSNSTWKRGQQIIRTKPSLRFAICASRFPRPTCRRSIAPSSPAPGTSL